MIKLLRAAIITLGVVLTTAPASFAAELDLPVGDPKSPVSIRSGSAVSFRQGGYEVFVLSGGCTIKQGEVRAQGQEAVLWVDRADAFSGRPSRVIAYIEGQVEVKFGDKGDPYAITPHRGNSLTDRSWLGRFHTTAGVELSVPISQTNPAQIPAIVERGSIARQQELATSIQSSAKLPGSIDYGSPEDKNPVQAAQYLTQELAPPATATGGGGGRQVRIFRRSNTPFQYKTFAHPTRDEQVTIFSSGIQVVVDAIDELGTVTIETDRMVIWSPRVSFNGGGDSNLKLQDAAYEFYLEGNIVFRQGDRVIYADRMYYNVSQESGTILSAEMLTPVPDYRGLLRLKAEVLQQIDKQHFQAYNAALTSSRLGVPGYWVQQERIEVEDIQKPLVDPWSGQTVIDPASGQPEIDHDILAVSRNNYLYFGGVPLLYWPVLATDLTNPTYYVQRIAVRQDRVFGTQAFVDFNMYQLLGWRNPPPNTSWDLSTDYLSDRGPALGTKYTYAGDQLFGVPGPYAGFIDAWGILDGGEDFLGRGRNGIVPETDTRGRILGQHRQYLPGDWRFTGELGLISDRNFLEQYFEQEWNNNKDATTGIELKHLAENRSFSITADVRVNDFFTQTNWLPKLDHYWIGESFLFDTLTWHEHSQVGYGKLQVASTPTAPQDAATFELLPWEENREGLVASTRQGVDLPLQAGPVKFVPYVLGEAAFWGEDLTGESMTRFYGQGGVRASVAMWSANPDIQSELLNIRGLAHKVVFDADYFAADASQDVTDLPLYHQLDDDAQEHFSRRLKFNTFGLPFGTPVPFQFDERSYAVRSGMQNWVTAPGTEIAEDLQLLKLGMRNRWQTKRGLPGQERIIDYIVLDIEANLFPDAARDNFGESLGMLDYDFQWHVGDRFSILSDGYADFFSDGLKQATIGGRLNRPEVGTLYLGYRRTDGPFQSNLILSQLGYRMSEKWMITGGTSIDLNASGKVAQFIALTRIGESFLFRVGLSYNSAQENVGLQFAIEPRFLPNRLGGVGGVTIPPAGAMGVE